jgi:hypothetical protein
MAKKHLLLFTLVLLFASCGNPAQDTFVQPQVRAVFRPSNGANTVQARVFIEGPDGNAVSGAVVIVRDGRNAITHLEYNSSAQSYNGVLEEPLDNSIYVVEVSTVLSESIITLTVPYSRVTNAPNVTVFQDSSGSSVLNGQPLAASMPIQIGWADSGDGIVYQLTIRTALRTVYAVSTEARTVTIPANTVPSGVYLLEITAQKIHGDLHFRSAPYYSVSFITAPMVSFNVN